MYQRSYNDDNEISVPRNYDGSLNFEKEDEPCIADEAPNRHCTDGGHGFSKIEERLKEILLNVSLDKEFIIHEMEVGECDHIHLFVSSHPKNSISYIVKMMKGISGRLLLREFPEITLQLWKGELWNPSYYVETIGSVSEENIKRYILIRI
jgi:putative transposase